MDLTGPTQVKQGPHEEKLPVLMESQVETEAYQRAPTLMGGPSAGSQGAVRVWAPNRRSIWISTFAFGSGSILLLVACLLAHSAGAFGYLIGSMFLGFYLSVAALLRPCYLTTDDAGIGITTWKGSRALRWSEIHSVQKANKGMYSHQNMELKAPDTVTINLTGYKDSLQRELLSLVIARANLQPHPKNKMLFVRVDHPALGAANTNVLPPGGQS